MEYLAGLQAVVEVEGMAAQQGQGELAGVVLAIRLAMGFLPDHWLVRAGAAAGGVDNPG